MAEKDYVPGPPFAVEFGERSIYFKNPTEGQVAVIARGVRKAKRAGGENAVEAMGLILDVIDKLVVEPEDRDWLEDGLIDGSVKLDDFIGVLDGINAAEEAPVTVKPVEATAARSGRR